MSLPIVVTHPSTLFHKGLRHIMAKSRFRPVRIATTLTEDLETYLRSHGTCVWLTGVQTDLSTTIDHVRRLVSANSGVKAVILSASQEPEEIVAALKAGACGFLCQDIPGERLLRSLELIALGEMIVHPQYVISQMVASENQAPCALVDSDSFLATSGMPHLSGQLGSRSLSGLAKEAVSEGESHDAVPSLSRREMLILRMLIQGASNKTIARNLVITELTVKVHMKAILRKLRLQNRTQAAIWARNNVSEGTLDQQPVAPGTHNYMQSPKSAQ